MNKIILSALTFFLAASVSSSRAEIDIYDVQAFFKNSKFSQVAELEFVTTEEDVPIMVLIDSLNNVPMRMMKVFDKDICISRFESGQNGSVRYVCSSGVKMKAVFFCTQANCLLNGQHPKKGPWKFSFKYLNNQKLSYAEVEEFMKIQAGAQKPTEADDLISAETSAGTERAQKLDKAKSICTELGFTLGTEKHGECVLKMMDN